MTILYQNSTQWLRENGPFLVDFEKMVQTNTTTRSTRKVFRSNHLSRTPSNQSISNQNTLQKKSPTVFDPRSSWSLQSHPYLMLSLNLSESMNDMNSNNPTIDGWRFVIDTPSRRYHLRTMEGEYKMWFWIEGIKTAIAKISTKQICEESFKRRNLRQTEENNFIVTELQLQLQDEKEKHRALSRETKATFLLLKRELYHAREKIKQYESQSSPRIPIQDSSHQLASDLEKSTQSLTNSLNNSINGTSDSTNQLAQSEELGLSAMENDQVKQLFTEAQEEISILRDQIRNKGNKIQELTQTREETSSEAKIKESQLENEIERLSQEIQALTLNRNLLRENNDQLLHQLETYKLEDFRLMETSHASKIDTQGWLPDQFATHCLYCQSEFTFLNRKVNYLFFKPNHSTKNLTLLLKHLIRSLLIHSPSFFSNPLSLLLL